MQQPSVIIIGSGFGGIGAAVRLKQQGVTALTIFEKAADVGGVWRDNVYPGAACDVPSHLYSFSFEPKPDWSRRYAEQPEIHAYLKHCVSKYSLTPHLHLNTEVRSARFDEARALWCVTLASGETQEAQVLITATGQLNRPLMARIKGLEQFKGAQFHSAQWDHSVPLAGQKVAVIGTGASAIQFLPRIAPVATQVALFQRSPPYVIPKGDHAFSTFARRLFALLPLLQKLNRAREYLVHEIRAIGVVSFPALSAVMKPGFYRNLRVIKDQAVKAQLTPDYPVGCKRIMISNDYYAALARSNVSLVTEAIREVTTDGIVTTDGRLHAADVLIHGTGFAALDFLAPMQITGLAGKDLNACWRKGAEAYLGISISGFPNLFMLYGPNTNLGHSSIVYMLESQIAYVLDAVRHLAKGSRWLDVKPEVQGAFNTRIQRRIKRTVWDGACTSWYKTAEGKNTNNWPGYTFEYRRATRRLRPEDYQTT